MVDLVTVGLSVAAGALTNGVVKGPFETLAHIWHYVYGYQWQARAEERKDKFLKNQESLQNDIVIELQNIPDENLQEPAISIIGPALEASKFYIDEEEIRKLFAKLIAASMDSSKNDFTHHAFIEIIKMLNPVDAKILAYLFTEKDEAITKFVIRKNPSTEYITIFNHVYLTNTDVNKNELIEPAIDNLIRMGLINVTYDAYRNFDQLYEKYANSDLFRQVQSDHLKSKEVLEKDLHVLNNATGIVRDVDGKVLDDSSKNLLIKQIEQQLADHPSSKPEIVKGIIELTAFGRNFCKTCLSS